MRMFRKDRKGVSPVIAIILMVAITVVLASVLYVWVMEIANQRGNDDFKFPNTEVSLIDNGPASADELMIKHTGGDPADWSKYKIVITNNTDGSSTVLTQLSPLGDQSIGEVVTINGTIGGFSSLDYEKGNSYRFEVYNLKAKKQVMDKDSLICE